MFQTVSSFGGTQSRKMALVNYQDLYPSVDIDDETYNNNLAQQIADIVTVESSAYECTDMEHIVDCVNCIRDVIALDRGYPIQDRPDPQLDYIHCSISWSHFLETEVNEIVAWHQVMKKIIEN